MYLKNEYYRAVAFFLKYSTNVLTYTKERLFTIVYFSCRCTLRIQTYSRFCYNGRTWKKISDKKNYQKQNTYTIFQS